MNFGQAAERRGPRQCPLGVLAGRLGQKRRSCDRYKRPYQGFIASTMATNRAMSLASARGSSSAAKWPPEAWVCTPSRLTYRWRSTASGKRAISKGKSETNLQPKDDVDERCSQQEGIEPYVGVSTV